MSETIVLSIRPRYVKKIFDGTKKFEFRRVMPSNKLLERVIIYESAPVSMCVGEFRISGLGRCGVDSMWRMCAPDSGIDVRDFYDYFDGLQIAQCYIIDAVRKYKKPFPLKDLGFNRPPQNFYYIPNTFEYETE